MKLVNIHLHKLILLIFIIGLSQVKAQETELWTLEKCIETAQQKNKNLQIGKNNMLISQQKHKEVVANLIPKINLDADYKYFFDLPYQLMPMSLFGGPAGMYKEAQFGVPHNINAGLTASMPLYSPDLYGAIKTTKIAQEVSELQYQKTEEELFFEISNLYYNAQILKSQEAFIVNNIKNVNQLLKNMKLLQEQKMVIGTDVSKVQLQVNQLTTKKLTISNKYNQVMEALKFMIGVSSDTEMAIESKIIYNEIEEYSSNTSIDSHLVNTQNKLLKSQLKTLRNTRYLPTVAIFGSYGYTGYGVDESPNDFLDFYKKSLVGLQLNYTLFNGTVTQRKINQKKYEINNNELQQDLVTDKNKMEINNANSQLITTKSSLETTSAQINLAQTVYDQTILLQKQGSANLTEILLADNALQQAQQDYISAIVDYLKADLELKKLTGNIK